MKHQTFVQKVVAYLKGGDEAKLARFEGKVTKHLKRQISMREDEIETLKDRIEDARETMAEAVVNIDVEKINGTDASEDYAVTYVEKVAGALEVIKDLEEEVADLEDEIVLLKEVNGVIFSAEIAE